MFQSCKSSVPAQSSFDKFKARPGPKCWYPSPPEARKVQKMEGSSPPEARKTEARHITKKCMNRKKVYFFCENKFILSKALLVSYTL